MDHDALERTRGERKTVIMQGRTNNEMSRVIDIDSGLSYQAPEKRGWRPVLVQLTMDFAGRCTSSTEQDLGFLRQEHASAPTS